MRGHTPGPWKVNKYGGIGTGPLGIDKIVLGSEGLTRDNATEADLHLMAAAPELLLVCQEFLAIHTSDCSSTEEFRQRLEIAREDARATIAKAEGQ